MKTHGSLWAAVAATLRGGGHDDHNRGSLTTPEQRAAFAKDGYVVIRGLLDRSAVDRMVLEADEFVADVKNGADNNPAYPNVQESRVALTSTGAFRETALYSDLPAVAAELMQLDPETHALRLIHDFFFSRNVFDTVRCDWHVDGHGLWPESYETPSVATQAGGGNHDREGINAWIALDDMPLEYEGSMAVSAGSHRAPWRYDAYLALGRKGGGRENGGETWKEAVERVARGKGSVPYPDGTSRIRLCALGVTSPDLYDKCEEGKRVLDLRAGDVVFCSRHLFHRTLQATPVGQKHYPEAVGRPNLYRYTIRYAVGSAVLPTGHCWAEWSILMNPEIAGSTLDEVAQNEQAYWFPKVWPKQPEDLHERLLALGERIDAAKAKFETTKARFFADVEAEKAAVAASDVAE